MNGSAEKLNPRSRQEFFFWCCAVVSLLALLGSHSLFWTEPRIAEAAREIAVTGRWYPLTINFRRFDDLPLLEVWSTALIFKFGVSEFAARLPSALAALVLLIGVRRLAGRLFDRGAALLAGWLTLGSCGVLFTGRCCGSGIFSGAVAVWAVAVYLESAGKKSFWGTLKLGLLLALGVLDRGAAFLWFPAALLLPWIIANWSRPDRKEFRRVAAAAVLTAVLLYLTILLIRGDPVVSAFKRFWKAVVTTGAGRSFADWASAWWNRRATPLFGGFYEVPRLMLPWSLLMVTTLGGALIRIRRLSREDRCLLWGIVLGFLVLAFPASTRWQDFLPLVPFLALEMGTRWLNDGGRANRWSVVATRAAIVVTAAFWVVSPVTIPVWHMLMDLELPMLFWTACFLFGCAVLLIMMLDSYPTRPLSDLSGLPEQLASTILGGTLTSICLISFLMPSLRELRGEKNFVQAVADDVAAVHMASDHIVSVGGIHSTAVLLFYAGYDRPVTAVAERGADAAAALAKMLADHPGKRFAVIARYRKRELDFLRRCAATAKLDIDLEHPHRLEAEPPVYSRIDRRACWMIMVPENAASKTESSTHTHERGK